MSKEYCCATLRLTLSARTRFFGVVTAVIEPDEERGDWLTQRILHLTVSYQGKTLDLPAKAFTDAGAIDMCSWEIRDEGSFRGIANGLYLVVEAPHEMPDGKWWKKTLHFIIRNDKLDSLSIEMPTGDKSSEITGFEYEPLSCPN